MIFPMDRLLAPFAYMLHVFAPIVAPINSLVLLDSQTLSESQGHSGCNKGRNKSPTSIANLDTFHAEILQDKIGRLFENAPVGRKILAEDRTTSSEK